MAQKNETLLKCQWNAVTYFVNLKSTISPEIETGEISCGSTMPTLNGTTYWLSLYE